jgi:hypothetical protein
VLILHIGRHKTGTSSIQHFCHHNRGALERFGIVYPPPFDHAAAHHGLALALWQGRDIARYLDVLRQARPDTASVLLSSEGFQRLDETAARKLITAFPTRVVVYLREQFSHAWSAYTQRVLGGLETLPFSHVIKAPRYFHFLQRWNEWSNGNLLVRIYERKRFRNGDVVDDFCGEVLQLDPACFAAVAMRGESLGWRAVNFVRRLNGFVATGQLAQEHKTAAVQGLRTIGGSYPSLKDKPTFPDSFRAEFQSRFVEDNGKVALKYFQTASPLFNTSWHGDSAWNEQESLAAEELTALLHKVPSLAPHRALLGDKHTQPAG